MSHQDRQFPYEQIEIVRWAASLGAVTAEALALRAGISQGSARSRLSFACRRGLLSRTRPLSDQPALFTLTAAGLRICDARGLQRCRVSPVNARHLSICAVAAAALERCYPCHRVVGERELRRDEREHGRPLASARIGRGRGGSDALHRPDLALWPPPGEDGPPVAIEVELTIKAPRRLLDICRAWGRCRTVAGVLYIAPENVERVLLRAVADAHAEEQVVVVPLSSLPGMQTGAGCEPMHEVRG